jgi:DNA segregation ATPase FtsK/SpoIIIE, S-DNA-T family
VKVVVTVVDDASGSRTEVLVDAPAQTPMRRIVSAMADRVGRTDLPEPPVDMTFARSGLVDGSVLHLGSAAAADATAGLVDLRVISGEQAGRTLRLPPGDARIGLVFEDVTPDALSTDGLEARLAFGAQVAEPDVVALVRVAFDASVEVRAAGAGAGAVGSSPESGSGLVLEGEPLGDAWTTWTPGHQLRVGDSMLTIAPVDAVDDMLLQPPDTGFLDYNRPPRLLPPSSAGRFVYPKEPLAPNRSAVPWIMVVTPMLFGIAMAAMFRQPFYLMFAFMSPIMMLGTSVTNRRTGKKSHHRQLVEHRAELAAIDEEVDRAVLRERDRRRYDAADAASLRLTARTPTRRLWERRSTDADHLRVRIGVADLPSSVTTEEAGAPERRRTVPKVVADVPVTLSLQENGVIGIAGPGTWPRSVARWMVGQLAVTQSPRDVQIVVLTAQSAVPDWQFATWIPHVRPNAGDGFALVGADSETIGRRIAELSRLVSDRLSERAKGSGGRAKFTPDVVVVFDGARRLRAMPGAVGLLSDGPKVGVHVIAIDAEEWQLPAECRAVVLPRTDTSAVVRRQEHDDLDGILVDRVEERWFDDVARAVSPVRDVSGGDGEGLVPDSANLLAVLGLGSPTGKALADRWARNGADTSAVVGVGIDGPFTLDLVRDGPHGLVAGTTGSGKSEFLQTLVASLAVANRPDAMTFVLVDYKGGAAFSVCQDLPHTVGMVTDLDTHLVERALRSLRAELTRREHILAAVGAKDIEDHERHRQRVGGERLPRLVIVIDEFAAMVKELPDFVAGLVNIAQRGRSLGVHLIMATQRPSGVVSPEIRANTNLRVALRMTDSGESSDVIDVQDAARIPKSVPGRAYARLGHSSIVPFQSARVGGRWTVEDSDAARMPFVREVTWNDMANALPVRPNDHDEAATATDLSMLVGAIGDANTMIGLGQQHSPWLAPLPTRMPLALGAGAGDRAVFAWGREDLPDLQEQRDAVIDLDRFGHLYIVGAPGSGRSQALRSIATAAASSVSSSDLHIHGIDCGNGALAALNAFPHTGAIAQRTQTERCQRLIERLTAEMGRRHQVIGAAGVANITEQRAAAAPADRLPHLLVLIDRWENFTSTLGEVDGGKLTEAVQGLLRDGAGAGVHVVIAGDRSLIASRMNVLTDDKIVMRLTDRLDFSLAGINHRTVPDEIPAGRGFRSDSGIEVQFGLLADPRAAVTGSAGVELSARAGGPGAVAQAGVAGSGAGMAASGAASSADELDASGSGQAAAISAIAERLKAAEADQPRLHRPFRVDDLPKDLDLAGALRLAEEQLDDGRTDSTSIWGLIGVGGDEAAVQGFDLGRDAPTFVVAGPARSGRSTMLRVIAESLLAQGTELVIAAPRPSPLRSLAGRPGVRAVLTGVDLTEEQLAPLLAPDEHRVVFLVDDGELLIDVPGREFLRAYIRTAPDVRRGLVLGGNSTGMCAGFGGWQVDCKKNRRGALLSPSNMIEGDLIGLRVPRSMMSSKLTPGRALVHLGTGEGMTLQVPALGASAAGGAAVAAAVAGAGAGGVGSGSDGASSDSAPRAVAQA